MHLSRLTITDFRNLKDLNINFNRYDDKPYFDDKKEFKSHAVIGQNGSGKSNFIEALIIIFRDLDLNNQAEFDYEMDYFIRNHKIEIKAKGGKSPLVVINGKRSSAKKLADHAREYLPSHIFTYYSGRNERIEQLFQAHQSRFAKLLRQGKDDLIRRLFYCRGGHSQLVLLACLLSDDPIFVQILEDLNIMELDSALFVLKQPHYLKSSKLDENDMINGDNRFWYAGGIIVTEFLDKLWKVSVAPIDHYENKQIDFRGRREKQEQLY